MLSKTNVELMKYLEKYHAITIKQAQRHFYKSEYGYDVARKTLRELLKEGLLQTYKHSVTGELVYYYGDKKISAHDLFILEFYSKLAEYNCKNIEFIKNPRYLKGALIPDGFFSFEYEDSLYFCLLEVDLTHKTSLSKFQLFEKLFKDGELKEKCMGTFPFIVVMSFDNCYKYESKNFDVIYISFEMENFEKEILGT